MLINVYTLPKVKKRTNLTIMTIDGHLTIMTIDGHNLKVFEVTVLTMYLKYVILISAENFRARHCSACLNCEFSKAQQCCARKTNGAVE